MEKFCLSRMLPSGCWPSSIGKCLAKQSNGDVLHAWSEAIWIMRELRQGLGKGRARGGQRPGRSYWPEAESVRDLIREQLGNHGHRMHDRQNDVPVPYFPRAEFGLPIIIEIRDENIRGQRPPIKPTIQYSAKPDRLASPVILKPLQCTDGSSASLILMLATPPLKTVLLRKGNADLEKDVPLAEGNIRADALKKSSGYTNSPLGNLTSALEAFSAHAITHNFEEVWP